MQHVAVHETPAAKSRLCCLLAEPTGALRADTATSDAQNQLDDDIDISLRHCKCCLQTPYLYQTGKFSKQTLEQSMGTVGGWGGLWGGG